MAIVQELSRCSLLLGAGFSRNWSGYLAAEVRDRLLGHRAILADSDLRRVFLRQPDYEAALDYFRRIDPSRASKIEDALVEIFTQQDHNIRTSGVVLRVIFDNFLKRFAEEGSAILFSLNQDLLLERNWNTGGPLNLPGVTCMSQALPNSPGTVSETHM